MPPNLIHLLAWLSLYLTGLAQLVNKNTHLKAFWGSTYTSSGLSTHKEPQAWLLFASTALSLSFPWSAQINSTRLQAKMEEEESSS